MTNIHQPQPNTERKAWLGVLARSSESDLLERVEPFGRNPFEWLRKPESGLMMLRARAGNTGQPFNVGEMTITRCTLRLQSGEVGVGYVQGRSERKAELVAIADALLQSQRAAEVKARLLQPLREIVESRRELRKANAASTRVEFFTMVRGE